MAEDPTKAQVWSRARVYVAFDLTAAVPANVTTEFSSAWDLVGLLDGDAGFTESRSMDTNDVFGWGGILVRTTRRNYKETHTFTALESPTKNATIRRLAYPGSELGVRRVPITAIEDVLVAFEVIDGADIHRLISYNRAQVTVNGDIQRGEQVVSSIEFLAEIYPDGEGRLWREQGTSVLSS